MKLIAQIILLKLAIAVLLVGCGAEDAIADPTQYKPNITVVVVEVNEGDRSMHCVVYYQRISCNWDAWNK